LIDQRLKIKDRLDKSHVQGLHITNGMFLQAYFWAVGNSGFTCWGDINQKLDLTSQEDVAKVVITAIMDQNRTGHINISANELSTKEIVQTYNKVLGKKESPKFMGTIDELKEQVLKMKQEGKKSDEEVLLGYFIPMFDGTGKIKDVMNSQFPKIKFTSLEEFLKKTQ